MDKNSVIRWLVIGVAALLIYKWGIPLMTGKGSGGDAAQPIPAEVYVNAPGFIGDTVEAPPPGQTTPNLPVEGELCDIHGIRFNATLSTRGAGLTHLLFTDPQYATSEQRDLSTTPSVERWRNLRTTFRGPGAEDQLKYDRFNWTLGTHDGKSCEFTYEDDDAKIVKTIRAGHGPFELDVETAITNKTDSPKHHRYSLAAFAYRENHELKGSLGRQSTLTTDLSCARNDDVKRKSASDFKEGWFSEPLVDKYAAVSDVYFSQALVPVESATAAPECNLLAEQWYGAGQKPDDANAAIVFHALLGYPVKTLEAGQTATYEDIAFFGPKERDVLANAAGGRGLGTLLNLGFFTKIAKVLVMVLVWIHAHITFGNWGIAIIVLTIAIRGLLFPLSWKQIQTSIAMAKIKPEIDAVNAKFKNDPQAKNVAVMQLYRTHKVNPFGGCLPQLAAMPVWWAMYTTLQTAVEMYHEKFLWFSDLSAPDKFYALPLLLGALMIVQQRIVPMTGVDASQQKMMMWLMPIIFTVMMLFLPAALGLYMLTSSALGIVQQLGVQKFKARKLGNDADIVVKNIGDSPVSSFGKGKARV
jgi:YidC/Oxa1 family membrane protein insertase